MGVYIKGMEMPKSCGECRLCNNSGGAFELGNDYCCLTDLDVTDLDAIPNWCPLIPVPYHGRLIDAGNLGARAFRYLLMNGKESPKVVFAQAIKDAPTIIPAEEGEE